MLNQIQNLNATFNNVRVLEFYAIFIFLNSVKLKNILINFNIFVGGNIFFINLEIKINESLTKFHQQNTHGYMYLCN